MASLLFCTARLYNAIHSFVKWLLTTPAEYPKVTRYLLSDEYDSDDTENSRVPENSILIEQWENEAGVKKCNLFYEGEEPVPDSNPFIQTPETPWIWIGDKTTEVDLTAAMQKYLVVGNVIRLDLILHMIQVRDNTVIVYINPRTLEEVKFPADGVRILNAAK
jgi:hypothetical protein